MHSRPHKLLTEFTGTFLIVLVSVGAICLEQFLRSGTPAVASGVASGAAAQKQSFAYIALYALIYATVYGVVFGWLAAGVSRLSRPSRAVPAKADSGHYHGHFNPAVTVAFWGSRRLATFDLIVYCAAQLAGASAAAFLLRSIVAERVWRPAALGTPILREGLTRAPAMLMEGVAAFFLVLVLFAIALRPAITRLQAAAVVGLTVAACTIFSAPLTGSAFNPARAFGPALAAHRWINHGVYWIGPLAGAVLAAWIYDAVAFKRALRTAPASPIGQ
jgi:glycerol uptake facilitator-like aquaporin